MTIDEAIKHAEEVAENKEKAISLAKGNPDHPMLSMSEKGITEYEKCINEHRQLAEWLRDYKRLKKQEPCEDAINRQAVKEQMIKYGFHAPDMTVTEFVEDLPPVNPQPKTGHWIDDKCSICGKGIEDLIDSHEWYINKQPNFCPFCGIQIESEE